MHMLKECLKTRFVTSSTQAWGSAAQFEASAWGTSAVTEGFAASKLWTHGCGHN